MCALANAAGKRVSDEYPVKEGIQHPVDGMMQQSVAHACLMDVPWLGIGDIEGLIQAMRPCTLKKLFVQGNKVVH